MDLTSFTKPQKKIEKKTILDNSNILVEKEGDEVIFEFKNKETLKKYEDFSFMTITTSKIVETNDEAQEFFQESLDKQVEGLMFKTLNSPYSSGLRTGAMAKLKETKEDIDVVVLAAEYGKGKRAGFYSSFYVGVKEIDEFGELEFLEIGKVSSGIKEFEDSEGVSLDKITTLLTPLKLKEEKGVVYFEPKIVLQIRYQEIQKSESYSSGYALRFPRIIYLREDKNLDEINSIEDISRFIN